ncbi:MAG: RyR domain-containing protein [Lachnospiraceae bacterium]|nr:RyR domain-containing protein [Lachnospiraceae bacterium]
MKQYKPKPIDTKDIILPTELNNLIEEMSKNVHEVWAETRSSQGWTYGEERNDAEKKHPCLVPYEELSEEEKEYDRNTSLETLKLIIKLGFKITKE